MAHFDDFSPIRTHRTLQYGSFAVLEIIAKLHTSTKPLNSGKWNRFND
jgi:hypothetical protein